MIFFSERIVVVATVIILIYLIYWVVHNILHICMYRRIQLFYVVYIGKIKFKKTQLLMQTKSAKLNKKKLFWIFFKTGKKPFHLFKQPFFLQIPSRFLFVSLYRKTEVNSLQVHTRQLSKRGEIILLSLLQCHENTLSQCNR